MTYRMRKVRGWWSYYGVLVGAVTFAVCLLGFTFVLMWHMQDREHRLVERQCAILTTVGARRPHD